MSEFRTHATDAAGLLIRLWIEPGAAQPVRARLLSFHGDEAPVSRTTAAGEQAVVDALTAWVRSEVEAVQRGSAS